MNLNHIRYARELSRTGSFTEASKSCCVTQPTLSNGIQQLEESLGGKLFERTTRKVKLTPFGEHMLPIMTQMLQAQENIHHQAKSFLDQAQNEMPIGFSPLADMRIIKAITDSYNQNNEGTVSFLFKECFIENLYEKLADGKIALAICPKVARDHDRFNAIPLYYEPVFFLAQNTTNKPNTKLLIDNLENETFALTPNQCGHALCARDWFTKQGKTLLEYPGQAFSYEVMQEWATSGIASAILPWSKINESNRTNAEQVYFNEETPVIIEFEILWKENAGYNTLLPAFINHCKTHAPNALISINSTGENFY